MAQVIFKRKTTEEIRNLPIDDGQLIYDTITGQTYMDIAGKRIKVGNIDIKALNVTFEDGENFQEKYNKGELKGQKGDTGLQGPTGEKGKTPVKGVDYFTTLEKQEIAKEASELIPISEYEKKPTVLDIPAESFELAHNTIYRKAEAIGQIIITLPALPNPEFICEIDFTASDSWIAFTAPASIKWLGDGIVDGAFVPAKGKRYSLIFYYDGVHFRAVSQEV